MADSSESQLPSIWPVEVEGHGRIQCPPGVNVLRAMVGAGASPIPVGCRSGGCGVCRIQVLAGVYSTGPMSTRQVPPNDAANGVALACRLHPASPLRVTVLGRRPATAGTAETHPPSLPTTTNNDKNFKE
jgi:ferredoxin